MLRIDSKWNYEQKSFSKVLFELYLPGLTPEVQVCQTLECCKRMLLSTPHIGMRLMQKIGSYFTS